MDTEFFNDPISVTGSSGAEGEISLQKIIWRKKAYTIVTVGHQWNSDEGRHVMAEAADGTRFELCLTRKDLIWRIKKVWRTQFMA